MDGKEILNILRRNKKISAGIYGVYSADNIPTVVSYPTAYIVNTDESKLPGQHWVAFYFEHPKKKAEYFDSYGLLPIRNSFLEVLPVVYKYSSHTIQGLYSITCGEYCLYFLEKRASNTSMQKIISSFSTNTDWNDNKVHEYITKKENCLVNTYNRNNAQACNCNNTQTCLSKDSFRF